MSCRWIFLPPLPVVEAPAEKGEWTRVSPSPRCPVSRLLCFPSTVWLRSNQTLEQASADDRRLVSDGQSRCRTVEGQCGVTGIWCTDLRRSVTVRIAIGSVVASIRSWFWFVMRVREHVWQLRWFENVFCGLDETNLAGLFPPTSALPAF